jgi:hypothetical protein
MADPPIHQGDKLTVGWREWVSLPDMGVDWIKAKIDTGARSSSLHAFNVETFRRDGRDFVRFQVHPIQRDSRIVVPTEAELLEFRQVRSSGGHETIRPVICTTLELLGTRCSIELTLASRDTMGFRMLLGRQALRQRFLIDPEASYFGGRPPRRKRRGNPDASASGS